MLLVHPGGPYNAKKDKGFWSIPKGEADNAESGDQLLEVAKREFEEETDIKPRGPFQYLGTAQRERDGKTVATWAFEGDCDPTQIKSNTVTVEWPPKSGKMIEVPEVDRGEFFTLSQAREKIHPYLTSILNEFKKSIYKLI